MTNGSDSVMVEEEVTAISVNRRFDALIHRIVKAE